MFDAQQEDLTQSVADAEAQNQHLAADRLAKRAQNSGAEDGVLRRVGWTKWSRPRAPKADGTRQSGMADKSTIQFLPVVRIGVLGALGTNAADIRESARSGSSAGI